MEVFQRLGILEQNAHFRTLTGAHHDGHGGSQTQCAGTGDHQHRNGSGQRELQCLACQHPHRKGDGRDGHDHRNKHTGNLVRQSGDGRLGAACLFHQTDHLRQSGILAHFICTEFQISGSVDGGRGDGIAGFLFHRDRFAGEGALVHRGSALHHGAVHRDPSAGADDDNIAHLHLLGGNLFLFAVSANRGGLGSQIHQLTDGIAGAALGPGLQEFAQSDQGQDHGGGLKIQILAVQLHHIPLAVANSIAHSEQCHHTVNQAGTGSNGNQGVHIGCPVPQSLQALDVVGPVQEHRRQRQQKLHQRKQRRILQTVENMGRRQTHHMAHGQIHQHRQECAGPDDPGLHLLHGILSGGFLGFGRLLFAVVHRCTVSGIGHSFADPGSNVLICHIRYHLTGKQIDFAPFHTGNSLRHLLHPGRAGGTGHTGHLKFHFH